MLIRLVWLAALLLVPCLFLSEAGMEAGGWHTPTIYMDSMHLNFSLQAFVAGALTCQLLEVLLYREPYGVF